MLACVEEKQTLLLPTAFNLYCFLKKTSVGPSNTGVGPSNIATTNNQPGCLVFASTPSHFVRIGMTTAGDDISTHRSQRAE
jgi:hypothetical protein